MCKTSKSIIAEVIQHFQPPTHLSVITKCLQYSSTTSALCKAKPNMITEFIQHLAPTYTMCAASLSIITDFVSYFDTADAMHNSNLSMIIEYVQHVNTKTATCKASLNGHRHVHSKPERDDRIHTIFWHCQCNVEGKPLGLTASGDWQS